MFAVPSLDQCVQRTRAAFRAYLPGTDAWIWPNNVNPTAKVVGGAVFELHGRLDFIARQKFALTAGGKYLEDHGAEVGIVRKGAVPASGVVVATVAVGLAVAAGARFARSDGTVVAATAAVAGTGALSIPVVAASAAAAGNSEAGTPLTALSGISGPGATTATFAVDAGGIVGGLDREQDGPFYSSDLATYRGRILFRKRNPPHGGAPADYVLWAGTVPGVTRVFVERHWLGPGTVRVFPVFDGLFPGGVADQAHVDLVAAYIATVAPAAAQVTVVAPAAQPIPVAVRGLVPNTVAVQAAVLAELADTMQRLGQVAGSDTPVPSLPYLATPFSFAAIWVDQAVANATGDKRGIVLAPTADPVIAAGSIPTVGAVAFQ